MRDSATVAASWFYLASFSAEVDGLDVTGCDFLTYDEDDKITDFVVMVRPLRAGQALASRMAERHPAIMQRARHGGGLPSDRR